MCENDGPLLPKIVQPPSFSLGPLSLQKVRQIFRGSAVLTPSPENGSVAGGNAASYSDESDSSESQKYSLPPTPSISDDAAPLNITPLIPKVKSVMTLKVTPADLRLHSCKWLECCVKCDTRESLHEHVLTKHNTGSDMLCEWVGCTLFGKFFRGKDLFRRHILIHTKAKTCPCFWEGCGEWFKDESSRRIHISKHIREKKARERNAEEERKARDGCHKHTFEEKAKLMRMARNKRDLSRSTVVRDNFRDVLPDSRYPERTMRSLRRRIKRLADCPNKTIELTSEVSGELVDRMGNKTWLLQAKIDRSIMCWSSNENSKVAVPLRKCPSHVLTRLGLYRGMGKRKSHHPPENL
eukprot:sb/3466162/